MGKATFLQKACYRRTKYVRRLCFHMYSFGPFHAGGHSLVPDPF